MTRRLAIALILVCAALPARAGSVLAEQWLRVQQALTSGDREDIEQRILELQQDADDLALRRLTPYAAALVLWSADHPGTLGESVARRARVLDPRLPSSYFLLAHWQWERRAWAEAVNSYLSGWWAVLLHAPSRRALLGSVVIGVLLTLAWTLSVIIVIQILRHIRMMAHDAVEVSRLLFERPNAVVLAVVMLCLPLFLGLGPVWLAVYLFVLTWAYLSAGERIMAVLSLLVLALLAPSMADWHRFMARSPSLVERMSRSLETRALDPAALHEFSGLEPQLEGVPSYHLILGELLRMHGDADSARLQFQMAAISDDTDPLPLVFLGNLSMEEGDIQRAIQRYNAAIEIDPRSALAYHNLSSAFDQSRRFQEGDVARSMARRLSDKRDDALGVRGRDARIRYPALGAAEMRRLLAEAPNSDTLAPALSAGYQGIVGQLLHPTSAVFWVAALVGVLLLVARRRWLWTAQSCSKCGKVFCPRCKTATESASYCSQCISVFLKRDMVSIDQQAAKAEQIQRWLRWSTLARRTVGVLAPGGHHVLDGRVFTSTGYGFISWLLLFFSLYWAPLTLPSVDPMLAVVPCQVALGLGFVISGVRSAVVAWQRR